MHSPPTSWTTGVLRWSAANALGAVLVIMLAMPAGAAQQAIILNIDGVIGPAIADYILRELRSRWSRPYRRISLTLGS